MGDKNTNNKKKKKKKKNPGAARNSNRRDEGCLQANYVAPEPPSGSGSSSKSRCAVAHKYKYLKQAGGGSQARDGLEKQAYRQVMKASGWHSSHSEDERKGQTASLIGSEGSVSGWGYQLREGGGGGGGGGGKFRESG